MVQWLRLCAPKAGGMGSIPGWRTKILHAAWCNQKKERKKNKSFYFTITYSFSNALTYIIFILSEEFLTFLARQIYWQ